MNHNKLFRIRLAILTVCFLETASAILIQGERNLEIHNTIVSQGYNNDLQPRDILDVDSV